jgi:hypothetical protein
MNQDVINEDRNQESDGRQKQQANIESAKFLVKVFASFPMSTTTLT